MSLWITPEGVEHITELIEMPPSKFGSRHTREQDILGAVEFRGGGYSAGQLVDFLANRSIRDPLWGGNKEAYYGTIRDLVSRGYLQDI